MQVLFCWRYANRVEDRTGTQAGSSGAGRAVARLADQGQVHLFLAWFARLSWRTWYDPLLEGLNAGRNGNPRELRLDPDVPVDDKPIRVIERARRNGGHARANLCGVVDGGATGRAEAHPQPAAAFVGAMFALRDLSLQQLHRLRIERRQDGKRTRQSALAKSAVADRAESRLAVNTVTNCAACTAAGMGLGLSHGGRQCKVDGWTWRRS